MNGSPAYQINSGGPFPPALVCQIFLIDFFVKPFFSIGNLDMLKEKINSIPGHLSNKHVFQSNSHHKCCSHGDLGGTRSKAWLDPDSKVRFTLVLLCSIKCFVVVKMIFNVPNLAYQSLLSHRLLQKSGLL